MKTVATIIAAALLTGCAIEIGKGPCGYETCAERDARLRAEEEVYAWQFFGEQCVDEGHVPETPSWHGCRNNKYAVWAY